MTTEPRAMSIRTMALVLLLVPLAVAGCGELTAGGFGNVETVLSGDAPEDQTSTAGRTTSTSFVATYEGAGASTAPASFQEGQPQGDVSATLEVSILSPQGEWLPLTDGLEEATVDISGRTEVELDREEMEIGLYPRVRVRFTDVQARVEAGLPVLGNIGVDFGDASSITVEREVNLELGDGDEVQVVIDLNSTQWLNAAQPALQVVAAAHLRNALEVSVR